MVDIRELSATTVEIDTCPVLIPDDSEEDGFITCGARLQVLFTKTVVGDDYGSWPEFLFGFPCDHTFEDMKKSARIAEFV